MNKDIRLSVEFWDNPKTVKLERRLGLPAIKSLQILWLWAAQNKSDGLLSGMDVEDIEIVSRWDGDAGDFVECLCSLRWIDVDGENYQLHGWEEHNPWASESGERSDKARLSNLARKKPEIAKALREKGIIGITAEEYRGHMGSAAVRNTCDRSATATETQCEVVAPSPSPSPSPKTTKEEKTCDEPEESGAPPSVLVPEIAEPAILTIPLIKKDGSFPVTQADIDQWQDTFPAVDVLQALKEVRQWNTDNPAKRKTAGGIRGHITRWLGGEQNKPRRAPPQGSVIRANTVHQVRVLEDDAMARGLLEKRYGKTNKGNSVGPDSTVAHPLQIQEAHGVRADCIDG